MVYSLQCIQSIQVVYSYYHGTGYTVVYRSTAIPLEELSVVEDLALRCDGVSTWFDRQVFEVHQTRPGWHNRTWAQPSREEEGHSPAPPSSAAADQFGPPGRQVTTGPPQPTAPNLQPEDMPSILPAVAAAEAAAHKPARITAQPASTTSSSSSASSTSSTSSSDPPLPAALILKATAKAKAGVAQTDPATPTQATRAPRQRTVTTPDPT